MKRGNRSGTTYSESGVDYSSIDPIKLLAQKQAAKTAKNLGAFRMKELPASRGESAYVWEEADSYRSLVIEGLGTKNLVADEMRKITGKTYYDQIAQDTVAMIVNDLIVVGALPNVVNAYFAVGDSAWMTDTRRAKDLIFGWAKSCEMAGAAWGGGETPALKGIINPQTIDLAGSAVGIIKPKERLVLGNKLKAGDHVVLIGSSGIHANGLSLARKIAGKLPEKYAEKLFDGRMYGEALLTPTPIYAPLVRDLLDKNVDIHYMVNITGHGWRKLMRATKSFTYELEDIPKPQAEFSFIQEHAKVDEKEMYGNFNMGAGFAIYVPKKEVANVLASAKKLGFFARDSGIVKKGPKQVVIKPKNIIFSAKSLGVR